MKTRFILFLVINGFFVACSKDPVTHTTSFQLSVKDHLTGDSVPQLVFQVSQTYASNNGFTGKTNAYGNFDTLFHHYSDEDYLISMPYESDYYLVQTSSLIPVDKNSLISAEVMGVSTLRYNFDCSAPGNGNVKNVSHHRLVPFGPEDELVNHNYGIPTNCYTVNCSLSPEYTLFSGDIVIQYEYMPPSGSTWYNKSDTISVAPGEDYQYTIQY